MYSPNRGTKYKEHLITKCDIGEYIRYEDNGVNNWINKDDSV
jgi:hypothetical protein